jgi:hypothetical protein
MNAEHTVGTVEWTSRTGGRLTPAERRRLIADLGRVHAMNAVGRLSVLAGVNAGRAAHVPHGRLLPPDSPLTRAAEIVATTILPATLMNHGYRTYRFARAIGEIDGIEVDAELLFAAAILHDVGLVVARGRDDFTLASARVAADVAEQVGLSTAATHTLQTAITSHHSPRVTRAAGPVAHLLSVGAGVDVAGLRSWDLPDSVLADAVREHPREGFKTYFSRAWADEAARVPEGRARLLRRYGAFTAAIRLAPFDE